jgi:hypothetical protein
MNVSLTYRGWGVKVSYIYIKLLYLKLFEMRWSTCVV